MTKKEAIIKYISEMNIKMLSLVLENDRSFMSLYIDDFLDKLQEIFEECEQENSNNFLKVIKGVSEDIETKGIKGYQFITNQKKAMNLLFEEENNKIIEIHNCSNFRTYQDFEVKELICFSIYDDEKIGYVPTFENIILTQKIDNFFLEYEMFKHKTTPIEVVAVWFNSIKEVYDSINVFENMNFKFYVDFSELVVNNIFIQRIVENNEISRQAIKDYKNINPRNENEIFKWLQIYSNVKGMFAIEFKNNCNENNLLTHKEDESIILDIRNYKYSLIFEEIYNKHKPESDMIWLELLGYQL